MDQGYQDAIIWAACHTREMRHMYLTVLMMIPIIDRFDALRDILVNPLAGFEAFGDTEAPVTRVAAHGLPVPPPNEVGRSEAIAANVRDRERGNDAFNRGENESTGGTMENKEVSVHEGGSRRIGQLGDEDGTEDDDGWETVATEEIATDGDWNYWEDKWYSR